MKLPQYIYDLILANLLFGVSYSVVVSLLEGDTTNYIYTPDEIFVAQVVVGALLFLPYIRWRCFMHHLPHILRNTIILLFGWQRLTLAGSLDTPPMTIAAISLSGLGVTLIAARDIHRLRLLCLPLMAIVVALPHLSVASELSIFVGVVCVAVSTLLARDVMGEMGDVGGASLLALYFSLAILLLPLLTPCDTVLHLEWGERGLLLLFQTLLGSSLPLYLMLRGSSATTPLVTALCRYVQCGVAVLIFYVPELSCTLMLTMVALSALEIFVRD